MADTTANGPDGLPSVGLAAGSSRAILASYDDFRDLLPVESAEETHPKNSNDLLLDDSAME